MLGEILLRLNSIMFKLAVVGTLPNTTPVIAGWTLVVCLLGGFLLWRPNRIVAWMFAGQALLRVLGILYLGLTPLTRWGVLAPDVLMNCYVAILELAAARYALKASRLRQSGNA